MKISIIIPYRDRKQGLALILKQFATQEDFLQEDYEIVIVNLGSESVDLSNNKQAKEIHVDYKGIFSRGWALNIGVKRAPDDNYIMFLDADCIPHLRFLSLIKEHFNTANLQFAINSPVMFLNNDKSRYILNQESYSMEDYKSFAGNRRVWVKPRIDGTSQVCLAKKHFIDLGGFDENFIGHGAEDILLHDQLATYLPNWGKWPNTIDVKWSIDRNLILTHLYHGKRNHRSPYMARYKINWQRYRNLIGKNVTTNNHKQAWGLIEKPPKITHP